MELAVESKYHAQKQSIPPSLVLNSDGLVLIGVESQKEMEFKILLQYQGSKLLHTVC